MKFQLLLLFCTFLFVSCQAEEQVAQIVPPTTTTAAQPTDTPAPTAVPTSTPIATPNPIPVSADEGWELHGGELATAVVQLAR